MADTLTIRLPRELAQWLDRAAAESGVPRGQLIRVALENSRVAQDRATLRLAGMLDTADDFSCEPLLAAKRLL
jgi:predicted transcriptional regulator